MTACDSSDSKTMRHPGTHSRNSFNRLLKLTPLLPRSYTVLQWPCITVFLNRCCREAPIESMSTAFKPRSHLWFLREIRQVLPRRYLLRECGMEIFTKNYRFRYIVSWPQDALTSPLQVVLFHVRPNDAQQGIQASVQAYKVAARAVEHAPPAVLWHY